MHRDAKLTLVLVVGAIAACQTDHAALEQKPGDEVSVAGASGAIGRAGSAASPVGGDVSGGSGSSGHADDEPPGRSVFTLVNGIVDAPSIFLCMARAGVDGGAELLPRPVTSEFVYGKSLSVSSIDGAVVAEDTLQPVAIAGELGLIAGLDCPSAVARAEAEERAVEQANAADEAASGGTGGKGGGGTGGGGAAGKGSSGAGGKGSGGTGGKGSGGTGGKGSGGTGGKGSSGAGGSGGTAGRATGGVSGGAGGSGTSGGASDGANGGASSSAVRSRLRVAALPAVPAGTLNAGRSILYVLTGCLGGSGFDAPKSEEYCGAGYGERTPTLSALLVSLSRKVATGFVGLQFVHASRSTPAVSVSSAPPFPATQPAVPIADNVVMGQAAPRTALLSHPATDYGGALYRLQLTAGGEALSSQSWSDALSRGGLRQLENGVTYALVLVGPSANHVLSTPLWNPPVITAIAVDPP